MTTEKDPLLNVVLSDDYEMPDFIVKDIESVEKRIKNAAGDNEQIECLNTRLEELEVMAVSQLRIKKLEVIFEGLLPYEEGFSGRALGLAIAAYFNVIKKQPKPLSKFVDLPVTEQAVAIVNAITYSKALEGNEEKAAKLNHFIKGLLDVELAI
tara:strand:+ start:312 stop:773 length:462 start_codon:yes stop_codon:yes gene_type:complete